MPHSYLSIYIHYIFSTKNREEMILPEIRERLWEYMGGIARENKMKSMIFGGVSDHAHGLISLPSTITVAKAIQLIKGGSSKWVSDTFPQLKDFTWQVGYGAFSVGVSYVDETIQYIKNQKAHHRKITFQEEFLAILKKHGIEYDERYIWG